MSAHIKCISVNFKLLILNYNIFQYYVNTRFINIRLGLMHSITCVTNSVNIVRHLQTKNKFFKLVWREARGPNGPIAHLIHLCDVGAP